MNPTSGEITIHKGTRVGQVELIEEEAVATLASQDKVVTPDHEGPNDSHVSGKKQQIVATDIVGPFPESENGNIYVLMAADYFTRCVEAYAIPNQEVTTVANKLVDEMFLQILDP